MKPSEATIKEYIKNNSICPWCGYHKIISLWGESTEDTVYRPVECDFCGAKWHDEFKLKGISFIDSGKRVYING